MIQTHQSTSHPPFHLQPPTPPPPLQTSTTTIPHPLPPTPPPTYTHPPRTIHHSFLSVSPATKTYPPHPTYLPHPPLPLSPSSHLPIPNSNLSQHKLLNLNTSFLTAQQFSSLASLAQWF